jgi:hypothetical protein
MTDYARRMSELFRGNQRAHGTYTREEKTPGKVKSVIKKTASTVRDPPTVDLWQQHLDGSRPIGIIPIDSSSECHWAVIDVDRYDVDHMSLVMTLARLKIPMVVCKSKSGGAHLFIFMREPVHAEMVVSKMREIAGILGFGDCEIFPKQTVVLEDRGDVGNWLNMPYFDVERGTRYAVTPDGRGMSLERFLEMAEPMRLTEEQFLGLRFSALSSDADLADGPPCLQYMCGTGIPQGQKNNTMFALGVLAKKMRSEGWEQFLDSWNQKYVDSPKLTSEEMIDLQKRLRKKEYFYRCKDQPLVSHCDSKTCRSRKFGVGEASAPDITSISVLDTTPPLFFVCLTNGGTVECTADDMISSRAFQRVALTQLRVFLPLFKQEQWQTRMHECLEQAVVIEAPREVSTTGAFEDHLAQFCTDRHAAQARDEILLGKPWLDDETQMYFFRLSDLMQYLERVKFREFGRNQIAMRIKDMGGKDHFFVLRGQGTRTWAIPRSSFSVQTESHSVPRSEESPV